MKKCFYFYICVFTNIFNLYFIRVIAAKTISHILFTERHPEAGAVFLLQPMENGRCAGLLFAEQTLGVGIFKAGDLGLQLLLQTHHVGLHDQGVTQRIAVVIQFFIMHPAEAHGIGDSADIRLHVAGTGADGIFDRPVLCFPLQIAEGTFITGFKGLIYRYGIDLFFHSAASCVSFFIL